MCWRFTVTGVPLHSVTFRNIGKQWHRIAGVRSQWLLTEADGFYSRPIAGGRCSRRSMAVMGCHGQSALSISRITVLDSRFLVLSLCRIEQSGIEYICYNRREGNGM